MYYKKNKRTRDLLSQMWFYPAGKVFVKECGSREVSYTFNSTSEFEEWLTKNQRNVKGEYWTDDWDSDNWFVRLAKKEVA